MLSRQRIERDARQERGDLLSLLAMAAFGAVIGQVALAWVLLSILLTTAA